MHSIKGWNFLLDLRYREKSSMKKIAILTIATGKYIKFIPDLIDSCESFFIPKSEKKYFIFTDGEIDSRDGKVIKIDQNKLGWPYDTMMRFHMFSSIEKDLEKFDFIFFMNANMKVVSSISRRILPTKEESGLVVTHHPGFYKKHPNLFTYERNPTSNFYIPFGSGNNYVQGCFNGGRSSEFLEMCRQIKKRIDSDLENKIIPVWHDESALNWYMIDKTPKILHPVYAWPEFIRISKEEILEMSKIIGHDETNNYLFRGKKDPHLHIREGKKIKIIQRDKNFFGGKSELRS
jgi:hypothetical protein